MSLKSWKKEFCPVAAGSMVKKSRLAIVERDLRKWEGLTSGNLKKHGLTKDGSTITDGEAFLDINAESCALCTRYEDCLWDRSSRFCPLSVVRGFVSCDKHRGYEIRPPYQKFINQNNPQYMLYWLRRAKEMLEKA